MTAQLLPYSLTFPVLHAVPRPPDGFSGTGDVAGTCFSLGGDLFLTAGHVARGITQSGKLGVILVVPPAAEHPIALRVADTEELQSDLAVLRVPGATQYGGHIYPLRWRRQPIVQLDAIWTLGFAYGSHRLGEQTNVIQRAFRGHVVSDPPAYEIPEVASYPLCIYEISFAAPRGLSGSPLLFGEGSSLTEIAVAGVVIGNSTSKMLVFSSREVDSISSEVSIVEQYESLSLGVAIQATSVFGQYSNLAGVTIGARLATLGLIAAV